nr:uncharacterized protein LOC104644746 [Solanum lycopersicum]XP_019066787.1 uncharacterized protein LOC109118989 [Solanum lycopersicum]
MTGEESAAVAGENSCVRPAAAKRGERPPLSPRRLPLVALANGEQPDPPACCKQQPPDEQRAASTISPQSPAACLPPLHSSSSPVSPLPSFPSSRFSSPSRSLSPPRFPLLLLLFFSSSFAETGSISDQQRLEETAAAASRGDSSIDSGEPFLFLCFQPTSSANERRGFYTYLNIAADFKMNFNRSVWVSYLRFKLKIN